MRHAVILHSEATPKICFREARAHQRGVALVIAMIVLVAMALAAVALTRSVDIANIVAGNLSFKQSALSATDIGVAAAFNKFNAGGPLYDPSQAVLNNDSAANAYFASIQQANASGVPNALLDTGTFDTTYGQAKFCIDKDGNQQPAASCSGSDQAVVRYVIERQCTTPGPPSDDTCYLAKITKAGRSAVPGGSALPGGKGGATGSTGGGRTGTTDPIPLIRITVRIDGPKNTVSYSQTTLRPFFYSLN